MIEVGDLVTYTRTGNGEKRYCIAKEIHVDYVWGHWSYTIEDAKIRADNNGRGLNSGGTKVTLVKPLTKEEKDKIKEIETEMNNKEEQLIEPEVVKGTLEPFERYK